MRKILLVARREFLMAITTKGFVVGLLVLPALVVLFAALAPRLLTARTPPVDGEVAVIDPTGTVLPELRLTLTGEAIAARRRDAARRALAETAPGVDTAASQEALERVNPAPVFTVIERSSTATAEAEKSWLLSAPPTVRRLALVVIDRDAVARTSGNAEFGTYELFVSRDLDESTESTLYEGIRQAVVNARLKASNLDPATVEATMRMSRAPAVIVAEGGDLQAQRGFTRLLPFILGALMFVGVMMGGQSLMTATVEEKSSRVIEVLLSAVSPLELMAGKLLGQTAIGLVVLTVYIGLGFLTLMSFAMVGLLDPMLVVYLVVFFLITYVLFSALMMAIGAAVNQIAEAQSLMGPIMILLVLPYLLSPMIGRAPNSTFSVLVSFIPPVNTFAMMSRLASDSPPPAWQAWLTVLIGIGAACAAVWFAAKVFKVGLLMHGKAPNLATLVRWARAA